MLPVVLLSFAFGIIFAIWISKSKPFTKSSGALRIDSSDPDGPYFFLELTETIDSVQKKRKILLDVDLKNYISQK